MSWQVILEGYLIFSVLSTVGVCLFLKGASMTEREFGHSQQGGHYDASPDATFANTQDDPIQRQPRGCDGAGSGGLWPL